jgi:hypothetical protein
MIDPKMLCELFVYDPETGKLFWKSRDGGAPGWNGKYAGKEAFTSTNSYGYKQGSILGGVYRAHRVIWAMVNGEWPEADIDHINGNRTDNRIVNLRSVSRSENCMNSSLGKRNKSGVVGVCWSKREGKWKAQIQKDGKNIQIGHFSSFDEAVSARLKKQNELSFHKNHGKNVG